MEDILVDVVSRIPGYENVQVGIATSERNTVAGLIRKACKEAKIPLKSSYTLRDSKNNLLQWSNTLIQCGVKHSDILSLSNEDGDEVTTRGIRGCSWNSWWFIAAICLLIGGVGITAIAILLTKNGAQQYEYGIVFDAGSSHSKMFVYKWNGEKVHDTALAHQIHHCTVKDNGLTSYIKYPVNLTGPLSDCVEEAKHFIPVDKHKDSPIFLGATAGMRMLQEVQPSVSQEILMLVGQTFQTSPFQYLSSSQARIITGQEEGTFGWVTANFLSQRLGVAPLSDYSAMVDPSDTVGALDMGGASTQITFYTPSHADIPDMYKEDVELYGNNFTVYTHSYLCYGINEAIRRYKAILVHSQEVNGTTTNITNPCGPEGNITVASHADIFEAPCANQFAGDFFYLRQKSLDYYDDPPTNYTFYGTGNETQCVDLVGQLFNFTAACPSNSCSFNGTFQPSVYGQFYAFSSFFYEMDFLNLTKHSASFPLKTFETKLSKLCNTPWAEVSTMKAGENGSMLGWYCFEGHYIHTLLTQGYKFDNQSWENIQFIRQINNTDVGWTLGYMINSSNIIPAAEPINYISVTAFSALTALFAIFILLSVAFGCHARYHRDSRGGGLYERVPAYGAV